MKTLKRSCVLAVALSALLCAGCDTDGYIVEGAVKFCEPHGGVTSLGPIGTAQCSDGTFKQILPTKAGT